jgi:uncharacterized protein (TIGR02678 family)
VSRDLSFTAASERHERQRALRALLMRPVLHASGPHAEAYGLVRVHAAWIREWLQRNTGWRLDLDTELARLRKTPADLSDCTRALRDRDGAPFTRRRYVLLCLALAALERSDRQTTLGSLAESIAASIQDDAELQATGFAFDLGLRDHRRDLVVTTRGLLDLRVLVRVQGDEEQYLASRGDVLYNVQRPVLARLLNTTRGPSTVHATHPDQRLAAIVDEPVLDHDDARNRRLRHRLVRRLLDDPVVLYDELSPEERAYLVNQRGRLIAEIAEATGLLAEVRAEGLAMVDDRSELSDVAIPEDGTEGHVALLVAEFLAARARAQPGETVPRADLERHVAGLVETQGQHWRRDAREPGAEVGLVRGALERLESLRLVVRVPEGVIPRPPIGRYAVARGGDDATPPQDTRPRPRRRKTP